MRLLLLSTVALSCLVIVAGCAPARDPAVSVTQAGRSAYPPAIEQSSNRQQQAENAWREFMSANGVDPVVPELHPILATPRSLPSTVAQRIRISTSAGTVDVEQVKNSLRSFISKNLELIAGEKGDPTLTMQDLSLVRLVDEGNFFRATYRQMSYPFPLANGFGELQVTVSRDGRLLQLSSRLLPAIEFTVSPQVEIARIAAGLRGRQLTYSGIDGRPLQYRVETAEEIRVLDPVIYPREEEGRILLHLAYPVEVGTSMRWTVYIDAITGQEIEIRQNFNT